MQWKDRCRILRWRSVEETDTEATWLSQDLRREATLATAERKPFLLQRADWLERRYIAPGTALRKLIEGLRVPEVPGYIGTVGWALALATGYLLTELGNEAEINLLAVPLLGILIWNAVVMLTSVVIECKGDEGIVPSWLRWKLAEDNKADAAIEKLKFHFHERAEPAAMARLKAGARAWLHIGAALLALGSIVGMYAKGWAKEYRAVWESTLLDESSAETFFKVVYGPASSVFKVRIPLEEVKPMHKTSGRDVEPSEALPWIHLYAGTLALLVILPRTLLAGIALWRGRQRTEKHWKTLDWPGYEARLLRAIEGGGEQITVLVHGWRAGEEPRDRWSALIRERVGGQARLEFSTLPTGDEDEFVVSWNPLNATVVVVFNAATTPEVEVQGTLVVELQSRLRKSIAGGRLLAFVDSRSLRERRSGDSLNQRIKLWEDTLRLGTDGVIVA
ncbi:MAG: hypothetical protein JWO89_2757 [Verrucomicrobiaceae bacterium]|nr:hypothetical protein [Verrucomicrobiaceae bacterium]